MLFGKKKKITAYINENGSTPFSILLEAWLSGEMKKTLASAGLTAIEIHVDFLPDYKCIGIQARTGKDFIDIQSEEAVFRIAKGDDEPDEAQEYPLISAHEFFSKIQSFSQI